MLHIEVFDRSGHRALAPDEVAAAMDDDDAVLWCDLSDPTDAELAVVAQDFGLHALAVQRIRARDQRTKVEEFHHHTLVVASLCTPGRPGRAEIALFLGVDWLITVGHAQSGVVGLDIAAAQERAADSPLSRPSAGFLCYVVVDQIVDRYLDAVDTIGLSVAEIEDRVFAADDPERNEEGVQRSMHDLRRQLLDLHRQARPLADALGDLLRGGAPGVDDEARHYVHEVWDHIQRVVDDVDVYRQTVDNTVQAHFALVANHQNDIMKRMTSWGAILILSTLIAGIYGMNFEHLPELRWEFGYPLALGMMAAVTVLLRQYFKAKDWL